MEVGDGPVLGQVHSAPVTTEVNSSVGPPRSPHKSTPRRRRLRSGAASISGSGSIAATSVTKMAPEPIVRSGNRTIYTQVGAKRVILQASDYRTSIRHLFLTAVQRCQSNSLSPLTSTIRVCKQCDITTFKNDMHVISPFSVTLKSHEWNQYFSMLTSDKSWYRNPSGFQGSHLCLVVEKKRLVSIMDGGRYKKVFANVFLPSAKCSETVDVYSGAFQDKCTCNVCFSGN